VRGRFDLCPRAVVGVPRDPHEDHGHSRAADAAVARGVLVQVLLVPRLSEQVRITLERMEVLGKALLEMGCDVLREIRGA
jgi:hypothetical protein